MVRGSNPGGGDIFRPFPDRPWVPPSLLYNGYQVFPGGKERPGRDADPSPPSSAVVKKEYSYTSTPPVGCTEPQCLYKGALLTYLFTASVVDEWNVSMEHWWNGCNEGTLKYSEKDVSHCHCFHHKSHMEGPVIEPRCLWWEFGDWQPYCAWFNG